MTKNERKALQDLFNTIADIRRKKDEIFDEVQRMNKQVTGIAWCSVESNCNDLYKTCYKEWAEKKMRQYTILEGKEEMMDELGKTLCHIDFWK